MNEPLMIDLLPSVRVMHDGAIHREFVRLNGEIKRLRAGMQVVNKYGELIRRALSYTAHDGPPEQTWWERNDYKEALEAVVAHLEKQP
jgi:hypothetical protein